MAKTWAAGKPGSSDAGAFCAGPVRRGHLRGLELAALVLQRPEGFLEVGLAKAPAEDQRSETRHPCFARLPASVGAGRWQAHIRFESYRSQDRVAMDAPRRQSVKL